MRNALRVLLVALLAVASSSGHVSARLGTAALQPNAQVATNGAETIRIGVLKDGVYRVESVALEDYVSRVLAGEAAPDTQPAALEALAVAIRTYTANNLGRHASEGFDLCDQTHCQVMRTASAVTDKAAVATANQILTYSGAPAIVYYSASCGGRAEKPSNVWPGADDPPYLPIHDDDACEGFPQWTSEFFDADLERALVAGGFTGSLRDVKVTSRDQSGRVVRLELSGMEPHEITGQDLRMIVGRTFGFQNLQSTLFDVQRRRQLTRFTGHGYGHGVGLCVIGSMKLAARGQSSRAILARYFPGTEFGTFPTRPLAPPPSLLVEPPLVLPAPEPPTEPLTPSRPPTPETSSASAARSSGSVETPTRDTPPAASAPSSTAELVVVVPAADANERAGLTAIAERERQAMAGALGLPAARARIRFHETAEQFERATGRPSFELGALVGDEIQLAPLWMLRERGMLERALRRAFVHAMADSLLPERPAWVREGAAVYFADSAATSGSARQSCPTDDELQHPVSIGSMGDAWTRARACFDRQVSGGRDWRRVR
jgi:SpoIID/LytB domain protein